MPRVEDIAWKFVIRRGKKWLCPYCGHESSGAVTRVKSHFRKQRKEGITSCTKVPGHIRKLMELLHNQVRNKDDIAWKFVDRTEENKWRCHHCSEQFCGDLTRVKGHLLGVPNKEISICTKVPDHVRQLMQSVLDEVAEEESTEPNGQSPVEPRMPTQAELMLSSLDQVSEEGSRQANGQPPREPKSRDMRTSSPLSLEYTELLLTTPEEIDVANLTSDQRRERQLRQNLTTPSLVQNGHGNTNRLQDCNQHSELPTPMGIDPSIASQQTSDSHIIEPTMVDLQVPEAVTNTKGPSSSQDNMNSGSPVMNKQNIYAKDEEIKNLKRKVEELEFLASSVRKKLRRLSERWPKETERARNNFQINGRARAETLPLKEQVETLSRGVEEPIEQMLPLSLLIEERDAKEVKFLVRKLIGKAIHRNIESIWDCLKENRACKLGIYGMGGVGKTTIMMHIHNRLLKDATFDGVAFITVTQEFSTYKLQSDIWKALKFGVMEEEHETKRAAMLSEQLERKNNCVLILDDVWERLDLEEVGIPVDGCKMVLTTRSLDVCRQMRCEEKIKIEPLSQEEAESLFWKELGVEVEDDSEIKAVGKSIVRECAGLPIGVITTARSMRGVTDVFEWRDSFVKLKESNMEQTDMEKVLMNLKFSYDRLGNSNVQQCFLSCALYPKDKVIDKFELIEFFIDQGLIGGLSTRKEKYDRGLAILNKLRNVCLLEEHGNGMRMHDLIRDMALHIMSATSIVKAGKQLRYLPPEEYWTDALEKVSLMENHFGEFPPSMSPNCPKLSILLLDYSLSCDVVMPDSFFKKLWGLKVLNLSGCHVTELPSSISDLVNLRALLLRECRKLRRIPYLGKLTSLRKLDARGCGSLEALEGLEKLVNLRYLDLTETRIERLPKGTLDRLLNLQYLKGWAADVVDITKLGALETF